jgi:hypothetical protein
VAIDAKSLFILLRTGSGRAIQARIGEDVIRNLPAIQKILERNFPEVKTSISAAISRAETEVTKYQAKRAERTSGTGIYPRPWVAKKRELAGAIINDLSLLESNLLEAAGEGIRISLEEMRDDAAMKTEAAYGVLKSDEGDTPLNDSFFPTPNPGPILRNSPVVMTGRSGKGIRSPIFKGKFLGGALRVSRVKVRSRVTGSLFAPDELDKIDRHGGPRDVQILIKSSNGTREDPKLYKVNGVSCAVKTITLRPRRRSRSRSANVAPWTVWRAIEYGNVANLLFWRVRARTVVSITESSVGDSMVVYGPEVVFMTARSKWWVRVSSPKLDNLKVERPKYWGGSAPIGTAYESGKPKINNNVRKEVLKVPGVRKGT